MRRETKIVAAIVAAIPIAILSAATVCAAAIASGASMKWRLLFRVFCHGIASRCIEVFGVPFPICARCTGIYFGLLAGLIAFLLLPRIEERLLRMALYVAAIPLAADGITQALQLRESTNGLRIATGFAAAIVFGMWVVSAMEKRENPVITIP